MLFYSWILPRVVRLVSFCLFSASPKRWVLNLRTLSRLTYPAWKWSRVEIYVTRRKNCDWLEDLSGMKNHPHRSSIFRQSFVFMDYLENSWFRNWLAEKRERILLEKLLSNKHRFLLSKSSGRKGTCKVVAEY